MIKSFLIRHSIVAYFILAYAISWSGILLLVGINGFKIYQGESFLTNGFSTQILLYVWLAMLAGPCIAGIALTALADGKNGIKKLFSSMLKWRVNAKWYAAALLIFPVLLLIICFSFSFAASKFYPSFMAGFGIVTGLIGGFFEEIGWTGFALSKLQLKYSPLKAGIILGIIHTFWHLLADVWGGFALYKELYVIHFFLWLLALTAFRLIAVWIYNDTKSLLLAQFTHASFTGSQIIFSPSTLSAAENVMWYAGFVITLWIVVMFIIKRERPFLMITIIK